jgi:hypothetical protein
MKLDDIRIKPLSKRIELTPDREERKPLLLKIDIKLNIVLEHLEKRRQSIIEDYKAEHTRWTGKAPKHVSLSQICGVDCGPSSRSIPQWARCCLK